MPCSWVPPPWGDPENTDAADIPNIKLGAWVGCVIIWQLLHLFVITLWHCGVGLSDAWLRKELLLNRAGKCWCESFRGEEFLISPAMSEVVESLLIALVGDSVAKMLKVFRKRSRHESSWSPMSWTSWCQFNCIRILRNSGQDKRDIPVLLRNHSWLSRWVSHSDEIYGW